MRFERESEYDEFKRSLRELKAGIQSMAAIMNKGGSGTVWFGVRPDGEAVGLDVNEKTLRDVSQAIGNQIKPQIYPTVTSVPIGDERGREVVRVDFHGDDPPYACEGWFIEGQVPERHLAGLDKDSTTRNELIARTLFRSKEIESYGSGMPRIKELCDEAGIRVEYRQQHDGTLLVFHRNDAFAGIVAQELQSHGEGMGETVSETVSENETINASVGPTRTRLRDEGELLSLLVADPNATYDVLASRTGFSRAKVARLLRGMRERGSIVRVGSDKTGSWRIVQGGNHG